MNRVQQLPSLHRYFLNASRNKSLFEQLLAAGQIDHLHTFIHLLLWYGCLFVVIEGFKEEGLSDLRIDAVLSDEAKLEMLRRCRNAIFHYAKRYLDPRVEVVMTEDGFVAWVRELHESLSAFFLAEVTP